MKILFPYMARWGSAHASRFYHLLSAVADLGHTVTVIQPPSRGSEEANDIDVDLPAHRNVTVLEVPIGRRFWGAQFPGEKLVKKLYFSLRSLFMVRRLIRQREVDLLVVYNLPQFPYLLGVKTKVVFDLADDLLGMLKAELGISERHVAYRCASWVFRSMLRRADVVTCISGPLFEQIVHPRKYIIPNGAPAPSRRHKAPERRQGFTVGYVGAFEYSMHLDQIVDAAGQLPRVRFLLVGAGRELGRIRRAVEERGLLNVELTGALRHEEAMRRVDSMDVCLNLFRKTDVSHAVSPLKLFEYLSHRKPVISTRLHEVERINRDFLYFADTAEDLVEKIRYVRSHPRDAAARARRGYQVTATEFAWPVLAKKFLDAVGVGDGRPAVPSGPMRQRKT
jgi:glycosyltransferase involved in cell wall biosynthesis